MALLDVTQDEAMDIALAAGARYQLAKIILVHKERLMKFMKHSARVPSSNKIVEKKFVRIGEGSMTNPTSGSSSGRQSAARRPNGGKGTLRNIPIRRSKRSLLSVAAFRQAQMTAGARWPVRGKKIFIFSLIVKNLHYLCSVLINYYTNKI